MAEPRSAGGSAHLGYLPTPTTRLERLFPGARVELHAKLDLLQLSGSTKERTATFLLHDFSPLARNAGELVEAAGSRGVTCRVFVARKANKSLGLVDAAMAAGHGIDVASLRELIAFQKSVLPAATASVYVPPSNILSKEGRQTIGRDVPEIRTIASTYLPSDSKLPYVQEFGVADDGIVEAPRIVSGGMVGDYMRLAAESELNMHFVSTHFMHPDDMLDPDRGAKEGWAVYRKGLENYLDWLEASAPSIRMQTGTECASAVQRFSGLTVKMRESANEWEFDLGNFKDQAWLLLRANHGTPGRIQGGSMIRMTGNLYLIKATDSTVHVERKAGGAA